MKIAWRHLASQTQTLGTLGRVALGALRPHGPVTRPALPGPWRRATLAPRDPALVRAFVTWAGGDPGAYRGVVPATLVPQWGFPLAAEAMRGLGYPLLGVLNAGCRLERRGRLDLRRPLEVAARLVSVDDNGARAVITVEVLTGTADAPDQVRALFRAMVRLGGAGRAGGRRPPVLVPLAARELSYGRLDANAGAAFAVLTGDLNPIHWLKPWARASGFGSVILHGFGTLARAHEALVRGVAAGDPEALSGLDVRFVAPLVLPASVGTYQSVREVSVGVAPGGPAYLTGRFAVRGEALDPEVF